MLCEVCGKSNDCFFFSITVSNREDAEEEHHVLCVRHYRRWMRWHNYRNWLKKMRREVTA